MKGINIWSGSDDPLGAVLTNMTELAFSKARLNQHFPVIIEDIEYPDAEAAYQHLKGSDESKNNDLMIWIICCKLTQHKVLIAEIANRGGLQFLESCSHFTGARTKRFQAWEGQGKQSRFIRNLIAGYKAARRISS